MPRSFQSMGALTNGVVSCWLRQSMNGKKYLSWWCGCALMLSSILAGWAQPSVVSPEKAPSMRKTVVVLGDSLAAGYGVDPSEAYPTLLQEKIDATGLNFI